MKVRGVRGVSGPRGARGGGGGVRHVLHVAPPPLCAGAGHGGSDGGGHVAVCGLWLET